MLCTSGNDSEKVFCLSVWILVSGRGGGGGEGERGQRALALLLERIHYFHQFHLVDCHISRLNVRVFVRLFFLRVTAQPTVGLSMAFRTVVSSQCVINFPNQPLQSLQFDLQCSTACPIEKNPTLSAHLNSTSKA